MSESADSSPPRRLLPYYVLTLGLALTALATYGFHNSSEARDRRQFELAVQQVTETVRTRLEAYIALLRGASGLFVTQSEVNLADFALFVQRLRIPDYYPGVQGIGFAKRLQADAKDGLIVSMREQGAQEFKIWPEFERNEYYPIIYLEPLDRRNREAIGYDMFTEPVRREAMGRARDQGSAAASGRVTLVQEIEGPRQAGFLIYLPSYRGGAVPQTTEERRERLMGFAYSPFRAGDLFTGIFGGAHPVSLDFQAYDGTVVAPNHLLYSSFPVDSRPSHLNRTLETKVSLSVAGRAWTFLFWAQPKFYAVSGPDFVPLFALSGLLGSIALFYFTLQESRARDLADRVARELRQSEHRFRMLFEQSPLTLQVFAPDGQVIQANQAWEHLWQASRRELEGYNLLADSQLSSKGAMQHLRRAFAGEPVAIPAVRYDPAEVHKTGRARWVEAHAYPVKNGAGQVVEVVLMLQDVTARKRAEQAAAFLAEAGRVLTESLDLQQTLKNLSRLVVPEFADWCMIDIVSAAGRLDCVGVSHRDPTKSALAEEMGWRYPPNPEGQFGAPVAVRTGERQVYPEVTEDLLREAAPTPEQRYALAQLGFSAVLVAPIKARERTFGAITFVYDGSGRGVTPEDIGVADELAARAGLAIDNAMLYRKAQEEIREREHVVEELRQSEERFRLMVERTQDYAIIMLDPGGRISHWNVGAERILRHKEEEIIGKEIGVFFTPEDKETGAVERELEQALKTGQAADERWHIRKDGERFWASGSLIALRDSAGKLRGFAKIMRDMTERKRTDEAIRRLNRELEERVRQRTAALQESTEQMEAFTYTVAHDLRAPLRAMQGFSQALEEEHSPALDATGRDYLRRIVTAAQRMDALIQDLLAYSRLSRTSLQFDPVDLDHLVANVLVSSAEEIEAKHAKVSVESPLPKVQAHGPTLEHVMANLVWNALKFVRPDATPEVRIWSEMQGNLVRLWVQDNGIGIAPEHQDRIFRVFERLYGTEAYPGTGIGLAIVRKGMERMGGRAGVESELGKGSRFWLELPVAESEEM